MYNLHSHSILSDGCLLPSELAVRHMAKGYKVLAITDHADYSNIHTVITSILAFCSKWPKKSPLTVLPGVELTHIPIEHFKPLARIARSKGIKIIVAHGETPAEPVLNGTNRAALEAGIDILAHPGTISDADILLAVKKGTFLEVTTRKGHNLTNNYVIQQAMKFKARLILNTDCHTPEDIIEPSEIIRLAQELGLNAENIGAMYKEVEQLIHTRS
jgi:putative hydrolase